jgi:transposase-like protein
MAEKRRNYGDEFKREAVRLVTTHGYRVSETARNLGINPNILGRWKREVEATQPTFCDQPSTRFGMRQDGYVHRILMKPEDGRDNSVRKSNVT